MINEYALQPLVLNNWASNSRDYAEFFREYGLGTPRVISSFPKKKAGKLRSYFLRNGPTNAQSLQSMRYTEMVTKLIESIVLRDVQECGENEWNQQVKAEHERLPFGAVLSEAPEDINCGITPIDMHQSDSIWNQPRQISIERTHAGVSNAYTNLLRLSSQQIIIIDPYGWNDASILMLQHLIRVAHIGRLNSQFPTITLFYKEKRGSNNTGQASPSAQNVKAKIKEGLESEFNSIMLNVFELRDIENNDVFHNRCILSELGGIGLGHGISVTGSSTHTDEATILAPDIYEKKWGQFVVNLNFEIVTKST
tara:strand:+ start:14124 stop:15053 length:930 start_codon:yes stop_codon:yes gene_type:complete